MMHTKSVLLLAAILLTGCQGQSLPIPTPPSTAPIELPTPLPPPSPTPSPTPEPTSTPTPATFDAEVVANTLNLRSGPSLLHNILAQYQKGEVVHVIGVAPGFQWVKVLADNKKSGWMNIVHLTPAGEVTNLPLMPISESLVITGKVVDSSGLGIPGVNVAATRRGGAEIVRVDGGTRGDGIFFAYAPAEYQGTWVVGVIGVDCTSPIVDANCRFAGKFDPETLELVLPQEVELTLVYR